MSPQLLFWIPATLRLSLVLLGVIVLSFFFGPLIGLAAGVVCLCGLVVIQLFYLYRLSGWLDNPESSKLPDGWGSWTEIFARLYRLRRDDEKNRSELSEWLARFRQAMS